ncbi:uncharacterized protein HMPREF1541_05982 [Cyphellophora europaea CBS 101466]|uniref:Major facilitator superfamily (MFS) profile domain-containing protein n=1 Tax=Cyphellophora europaea (strain CBS 101466) TaxID=1220924 RepID=W2RTB6_CYPE1|nr:uncharacterized protein HMPREF1541_05982 [Cyphellophora europaea CBS 101466]ETN39756.1 hypothetical protein HMPREF1541_05982 [Cyphellophora europaea CBS 101466]
MLRMARGIDEGLIAAAFNSPAFQKLIHFDQHSPVEWADIKGNVTAMKLIGPVSGSLMNLYLRIYRMGRLWAICELCLVWTIGIAIFMSSQGNLDPIYAGRFVAGLSKSSRGSLQL